MASSTCSQGLRLHGCHRLAYLRILRNSSSQEFLSDCVGRYQLHSVARESRTGLHVRHLGKAQLPCELHLFSQGVNTQYASSTKPYCGHTSLGRGCESHHGLRRYQRAFEMLSVGQQTARKAIRGGSRCSQAAGLRLAAKGQAEKTCCDCGYSKPLGDFQEIRSSPDGCRSMCRACFATLSYKQQGKELYHLELTPAEAWERARPCRKCSNMKELRDFTRNAKNRNGLGSLCRSCHCQQNGKRSSHPRTSAGTSTCTVCMKEKSTGEFSSSKSNVNGLSSRCKSCTVQGVKVARDRVRKAGIYVFVEEKRCGICGVVKRAGLFPKLRCGFDGLQNYCKACRAIIDKERRTAARATT
jgi:hypothetical protein